MCVHIHIYVYICMYVYIYIHQSSVFLKIPDQHTHYCQDWHFAYNMDNLETKLELMSLANICYCNSVSYTIFRHRCLPGASLARKSKVCFLGGASGKTMDFVLCLCSSSRWNMRLPVMPHQSFFFPPSCCWLNRTRIMEKGRAKVGSSKSRMYSWDSGLKSIHLSALTAAMKLRDTCSLEENLWQT